MRRNRDDPAYVDEVMRRWQRRRWRVQQRERAMADLRAALISVVEPIVVRLARALDRFSW